MTQPSDIQNERYLTVPELADLLRIKQRKVYDLAANGTVPCSKVTGKLLFPEVAIRKWLRDGQGGAVPLPPRPNVILGSHDPLLEWALRHSRCGLASFFDGSRDGLDRFAAGEGIAAGLHLFDGPTGTWNVEAVAQRFTREPVVLIGFAKRQRGLVVARDAETGISEIASLAGRRFTPRQEGAGTQVLFGHLAEKAGLDMDKVVVTATARSESEAVLDVAEGHSDATFGLATLARRHGLGFVPLVEERFDLLVERKAYFDPALQTLFGFLRSGAFRSQVTGYLGYDASDAGEVRWNGG